MDTVRHFETKEITNWIENPLIVKVRPVNHIKDISLAIKNTNPTCPPTNYLYCLALP